MSAGSARPLTTGQRWRRFVRRYGWRAYALPMLVVLTVATLVRGLPAAADHAAVKSAAGQGVREPSTKRAGTKGTLAGRTAAGSRVDVQGGGSAQAAYTRGSTPKPDVITLSVDEHTCAQSSYAHQVIVSIHRQHLWACDGHRQVLQTAVTTGASAKGDATPTGSWRIEARQRDRYLVGPGYRDYVHYWMPFNGDFGLHDAPWEKTGYGSKDYPTKGSHGCVHLPRPAMAWLYAWAKVGETVVTIES